MEAPPYISRLECPDSLFMVITKDCQNQPLDNVPPKRTRHNYRDFLCNGLFIGFSTFKNPSSRIAWEKCLMEASFSGTSLPLGMCNSATLQRGKTILFPQQLSRSQKLFNPSQLKAAGYRRKALPEPWQEKLFVRNLEDREPLRTTTTANQVYYDLGYKWVYNIRSPLGRRNTSAFAESDFKRKAKDSQKHFTKAYKTAVCGTLNHVKSTAEPLQSDHKYDSQNGPPKRTWGGDGAPLDDGRRERKRGGGGRDGVRG